MPDALWWEERALDVIDESIPEHIILYYLQAVERDRSLVAHYALCRDHETNTYAIVRRVLFSATVFWEQTK